MLILSRVCAEFTDRAGKPIFSIGPRSLLSFLNAPEAIQEDPLFALMLADGTLEAVRSVEQRKNLESDPLAGVTPEGKKAPGSAPQAGSAPAAKASPGAPADPAVSESGPAAETAPSADAAETESPAGAPAPEAKARSSRKAAK